MPIALTDSDLPLTAAALIRPAAVPTSTLTTGLREATHRIAHPDGMCFGYLPANEPIGKDRQLLRVLMADSGTIQVVSGAGTVDYVFDHPLADRKKVPVIPTIHVLEMTYSFVRLVNHLAYTYLSYNGDWQIGLHIEDLYEVRPAEAYQHIELSHLIGYQAADYTEITTATAAQLTDAPVDVLTRLTRRLLRGLGLEEVHATFCPPGATT